MKYSDLRKKLNIKLKTCNRHKWELVDDRCWKCGAYAEYCVRKDCTTIRYLDSKGKEVSRDD